MAMKYDEKDMLRKILVPEKRFSGIDFERVKKYLHA